MSEARRAARPEVRRFRSAYIAVAAVLLAVASILLANAMGFPRVITAIVGTLLSFLLVGLVMRERDGAAGRSEGSDDSAVSRLVGKAVGQQNPTHARMTLLALRTAGGNLLPLDGRTVIGRNPENSHAHGALLRLPGNPTTVSKTHAVVEPGQAGVHVTDLGSTNGTSYETADGVVPLRPGVAVVVPIGSVLVLGNERLEIVEA